MGRWHSMHDEPSSITNDYLALHTVRDFFNEAAKQMPFGWLMETVYVDGLPIFSCADCKRVFEVPPMFHNCAQQPKMLPPEAILAVNEVVAQIKQEWNTDV